jgi:hypothetical protein
MQNAVAEQRVQDNALSGSTTISLRDTGPAGPKQARPEIEVIPEVSRAPGPISEADAVFCRDLLEFLGDFKSVAPKSSTVRRLGQAAVQSEPVARELAPHQDLLFDFLRAYEDAPKMRPLSQRSLAIGTPGAVAKGPGQIAATPAVAEPEDTPFRVPPYVSSVSENTGTEEALLDDDAAWLEPQDSTQPVADPRVAVPVVVPAAMVVGEPAAPAAVAQRPARAPAAKQPSPAPVAKRPDLVPVSKRQDPVPVAKRPAPAAIAKRPDSVPVPQRPAPVAASSSAAPAAAAPIPTPVAAAPSPAPVAAAPSPAPAGAAPSPAPAAVVRKPDAKTAPAQGKKRAEPRPAPAPVVKPLGPAAARAKAIAEGLIV